MGIGYIIHPMGIGTKNRREQRKMKKGVSKAEFIKSLETTLKLTREEISSLEFKDDETVIIHYEHGYQRPVNIACNSGIAIIRDIAKVI